MRTEITTQPGVEPISLEDTKTHCRIEVADDDTLVNAFISSARANVEKFLNRSLITQTIKAIFHLRDNPTLRNGVCLPLGPVSAIVAVRRYLEDNTPEVFASSNYRLSGDRVVLNEGKAWPTMVREFDAFEVEYQAGYGGAGSDVPAPITQAMKMLVAHWYESREATGDPVISEAKGSVIPFGVQQILMPFRIYAI